MQVMVNKEDLEAANKAISEYVSLVHTYIELNQKLQKRWEQAQVENEQLRVRLSEFEGV